MARRPIAQRIAELEERKRSLVARLGKEERVRDTRRKILLGAFVLHRLAQSHDAAFLDQLRQWLEAELPGFLVRQKDLELFRDDLLKRERLGDEA